MQKGVRERGLLFLSGICMGAADLVPGISGGTVAFLLGFYDEMIAAVKSLNFDALAAFLRGRPRQALQLVAWRFLLTLGLGIVSAVLLFAPLLNSLLHSPRSRMWLYSLFMGLIGASILRCAKMVPKWGRQHLFWLAIGALGAFFFTQPSSLSQAPKKSYELFFPHEPELALANYRPERQLLTGVDEATLQALLAKGLISEKTPVFLDGKPLSELPPLEGAPYGLSSWFFLCGAVAVAAMLLPGISGSHLLSVLGAYPLVIGALADLASLRPEPDSLGILFSLALGILAGAALFSRLIWWLLRHYHERTLAFLIGAMAGSLGALWPFWESAYYLDPLRTAQGAKLKLLFPIQPDWSSWSDLLALALMAVSFLLFLPKQTFRRN